MKKHIKYAQAEEAELKMCLQNFWKNKPEKIVRLLKEMDETCNSIVDIKHYQTMVIELMTYK